MLIAEYNLKAIGTNGTYVLAENFNSLTYLNWYVGINSITFLDCGVKLETCAEVSCSLVEKKLASYVGTVSNSEPLHIIRIYGTGNGNNKQLHVKLDNSRIFPVNNISQTIRFTIDRISGDHLPENLKAVVHFSLYKRK